MPQWCASFFVPFPYPTPPNLKVIFSFVIALKEEPIILYDGLEIRPLSFGTYWVPVGYSLGWNPGKAPEIPVDAGGEWEDPGRGWGGEAGLLGRDVFFERLFFSYLARVEIKKMSGKFVIKE